MALGAQIWTETAALPTMFHCEEISHFLEMSLAEPQAKIQEDDYSSDLEKISIYVAFQRLVDPHGKGTSELHRAAAGELGTQLQFQVTAMVAAVLL